MPNNVPSFPTTADKPESGRASVRQRLSDLFLRGVRLYTYHSPIRKGKYRTFLTALGISKYSPIRRVVPTKDGRRFWADLHTGMHETLYFLGEYERAITELITLIVQPGDVCIDVGANFGWYTSIFSKYAGDSGEVHSFEPVPPTFDELNENYRLMGSPQNVHLNNAALGDRPSEMTVHVFPGMTTGHASLSNHGRTDAVAYNCSVITLDSYLETCGVGAVDIVKVDVEGAELMFLQGAQKLFAQQLPPVIIMEMALNTTKNFDYYPNDLVRFIDSKGDYSFFQIDEARLKLLPINGFAKDDIGANVLCFPRRRSLPPGIGSWMD